MKRLITARDVEQAAERHENLCVDDNTIVTAQAYDYAKELGVLLEEGICAQECHAHAEAEPAKAHECHHEEAPAERHEEARKDCGHSEPALSADEMERVIRAALSKGIWTVQQLSELLSGCGKG